MARTLTLGLRRAAVVAAGVTCLNAVLADPVGLVPLAQSIADAPPPSPWELVLLPNQTKPQTRFTSALLDGKPVLRVDANNSYGNLAHRLPAGSQGRSLAWRWRVDTGLPKADLNERSGEDIAIKVCAMFDEPMDKVPFGDRLALKAASTMSGTDAPTATLCYVWDAHLPVGSTLHSPFTHRIRYIVLRSGGDRLGTWASERQDLHADFLKLYGDEVKVVPPLLGIMVGADADNTHGHSVAYVGDLVLER